MSTENPTLIDDRIAFIDGQEFYYIKDTKFFTDSREEEAFLEKINSVENNIIHITLFPGYNSKYLQQDILNSNFYNQDEEAIKKELKPFNDDISYNGKKIIVGMNPVIVSESYGQRNHDEIFKEIKNQPFEDCDNLENIQDYFILPNEKKYPRYYSAYSLSRLNSNISVFGTIEEVGGTILTEKRLKGLKAEIVKNSTDARSRSVSISNRITLQEMRNERASLESYSDEEYTSIVTGNDELLRRSFNFTTTVRNGQVINVFDTSDNASSLTSRTTNKILFYTDDDSNILPFEDRDKSDIVNIDYNDNDVYSSSGHDQSNQENNLPDSMNYAGEID